MLESDSFLIKLSGQVGLTTPAENDKYDRLALLALGSLLLGFRSIILVHS